MIKNDFRIQINLLRYIYSLLEQSCRVFYTYISFVAYSEKIELQFYILQIPLHLLNCRKIRIDSCESAVMENGDDRFSLGFASQ